MKNNNLVQLYNKDDIFIFAEDFQPKNSNIVYTKGIKFKFRVSKNGVVHFKMKSKIEECKEAINIFRKTIILNLKEEINILNKIINIWETDYDKFIPIEDDLFKHKENKLNLYSYQENTNKWYSKKLMKVLNKIANVI
jgi:hypothetical protein